MEVSDGLTLTLGGTTIGLIIKELLAWHRSRNQKTRVEPTPLPVTTEKTPKYVTVQEFNKHVEDNQRDHENMCARLHANDKLLIHHACGHLKDLIRTCSPASTRTTS